MISIRDYRRVFPLTLKEILKVMTNLGQDENGCWLWTGANEGDYGVVYLRGERWAAHRIVYELFVGPILPDFVVDHRCRVPLCCNPDHLEAVTQSVNLLRGNMRRGDTHSSRQKTHCKHGHPLSGANLAWTGEGRYHYRRCRACSAENTRRHFERKKLLPPLGTAALPPISALSGQADRLITGPLIIDPSTLVLPVAPGGIVIPAVAVPDHASARSDKLSNKGG